MRPYQQFFCIESLCKVLYPFSRTSKGSTGYNPCFAATSCLWPVLCNNCVPVKLSPTTILFASVALKYKISLFTLIPVTQQPLLGRVLPTCFTCFPYCWSCVTIRRIYVLPWNTSRLLKLWVTRNQEIRNTSNAKNTNCFTWPFNGCAPFCTSNLLTRDPCIASVAWLTIKTFAYWWPCEGSLATHNVGSTEGSVACKLRFKHTLATRGKGCRYLCWPPSRRGKAFTSNKLLWVQGKQVATLVFFF